MESSSKEISKAPKPSMFHLFARGQWIPWASRWHAAVAGILLAIVSGVSTIFPIYSNFLKTEKGWTQDAIGLLATCKDIGVSVGGIVAGLVYTQYGGRITSLLGATICLTGFHAMGTALEGSNAMVDSSLTTMAILHFVAYFGSAGIDTTAVAIVVNFPYHKGMLSGLLKAHIALCSAFFTQLDVSLFRDHTVKFLHFCGYMPFAAVVVVLPFNILYKPPAAPHTSARASLTRVATSRTLWDGLIIYAVLAVMMITIGLIEDSRELPRKWTKSRMIRRTHLAVVLITVLSNVFLPWLYKRRYSACMQLVELEDAVEERLKYGGPRSSDVYANAHPDRDQTAVARKAHSEKHDEYGAVEAAQAMPGPGAAAPAVDSLGQGDSGDEAEDESLVEDGEKQEAKRGDEQAALLEGGPRSFVKDPFMQPAVPSAATEQAPALGEDHSALQTVRTADFWILWMSLVLAFGGGLSVNNNIAQIAGALGRNNPHVYLTLNSVGQSIGRIMGGFASDYALRHLAVSRVLSHIIGLLCLALSLIWMGYTNNATELQGSVVAVSVFFGVSNMLFVPLALEIFGARHFASIYGMLRCSYMFGSYLFADIAFSSIYNTAEARQEDKLTLNLDVLQNVTVDSDHTTLTVDSHGSAGNGTFAEVFNATNTTAVDVGEDAGVELDSTRVHDCFGNECFKDAFILMGFAALASAGMCVALYYRTLHIYARLHEQAAIDAKLRQHFKNIFRPRKKRDSHEN